MTLPISVLDTFTRFLIVVEATGEKPGAFDRLLALEYATHANPPFFRLAIEGIFDSGTFGACHYPILPSTKFGEKLVRFALDF